MSLSQTDYLNIMKFYKINVKLNKTTKTINKNRSAAF